MKTGTKLKSSAKKPAKKAMKAPASRKSKSLAKTPVKVLASKAGKAIAKATSKIKSKVTSKLKKVSGGLKISATKDASKANTASVTDLFDFKNEQLAMTSDESAAPAIPSIPPHELNKNVGLGKPKTNTKLHTGLTGARHK